MRIRLAAYGLAFSVFCVGNSTIAEKDTEGVGDTLLLRDQLELCIEPADHPARSLKGSVRSSACFSSSCTDLLGEEFSVRRSNLNLDFTMEILLHAPLYGDINQPCTTDCGGAGDGVGFELTDLKPGRYSVLLNSQTLGSVDVPIYGGKNAPSPIQNPPPLPICFKLDSTSEGS